MCFNIISQTLLNFCTNQSKEKCDPLISEWTTFSEPVSKWEKYKQLLSRKNYNVFQQK